MNKHQAFLLKSQPALTMAVKVSGSFDPIENVSQFEEQLTAEEYQLVFDFFTYLTENHLSFGSGNYSTRVKQFIDQS